MTPVKKIFFLLTSCWRKYNIGLVPLKNFMLVFWDWIFLLMEYQLTKSSVEYWFIKTMVQIFMQKMAVWFKMLKEIRSIIKKRTLLIKAGEVQGLWEWDILLTNFWRLWKFNEIKKLDEYLWSKRWATLILGHSRNALLCKTLFYSQI